MDTRFEKKAFTIIEVLLAAILLAAAMITLFSLSNRVILQSDDIFRQQLAIRLADEAMVMINRETISLPAEGQIELTGDFDKRYKGMNWHALISSTQDKRILKVVLKIMEVEPASPGVFGLTTYIYR